MRTTVQTHAMDAALALGALGAAVLTFQSWGIAASIAAALVVGVVVGARRGLSLPLALAARRVQPVPRSCTSPSRRSTSASGGASASSSSSAPRCSSAGRCCSDDTRVGGCLRSGSPAACSSSSPVGGLAHGGPPVRPRAGRARGRRQPRPRVRRARAPHGRRLRRGAPRPSAAAPRGLPLPVRAFGLAGAVALTAWALVAVGAA